MSNTTSSKYHKSGSYQQHIHRHRTNPDFSDSDDIRGDYEKALNYIETLKSDQNSLKNTLRLTMCDSNPNCSQDTGLHRQSFQSSDQSLMSPRTMERRIRELEVENNELKALLGTNSTRITKMQKDQQKYLEIVKENEALQFENKELKDELNSLNKEFCTITNKLLEVEVKNADLLSQSLKKNQDIQAVEKTSIIKYANYIYQLINSVGKNHFSYCCFEERFAKGHDFFNMIKSIDQSSLLLKAFKYITDLLININSQVYTSLPSSRSSQTPSDRASRYDNYLQSNNISAIPEDQPEKNLFQKAETPRNFVEISEIDISPVPNIVERLIERKSQREKERKKESLAAKHEEITTPMKNAVLQRLPSDSKDSSQFLKSNAAGFSSARYSQDAGNGDFSQSIKRMEERSVRSIESSPKRVQWKIDDERYTVEEEDISMEKSDSKEKEENKSEDEEDSEIAANRDLVARYKKELRERCKAMRETEKMENKSRQFKMGIQEIKEASYEQPEDSNSSIIYSEEPNTHKDSDLEMLDEKSPMNRLKNYLKGGNGERDTDSKDKSPVSGLKKKNSSIYSRCNQSDVSSVKTMDNSENWPINPKLRDYQINMAVVKKPSIKSREKTSSLTRESSGTRFTPVVSPRVKSPKSSLTYQQLNAVRKSRTSIEEGNKSVTTKRQSKPSSSNSIDTNRGAIDYASYSVSFWKNDSKNKLSPSPSPRVASIKDVPKKKKVESYPKQTYDVIKGQELAHKKR